MLVYITLFLFLLIVYSAFVQYGRKNSKFTTPPQVFFFGHIFYCLSVKDLLQVLNDGFKTYGSLVHLTVGPICDLIVSTDHKFAELVLSKAIRCFTKPFIYDFFKPWLGRGLLITSDYSKWKLMRKILTPAFHFSILKDFVDTFESMGDVFIERLNEFNGNKSIDVVPLVSLWALDVICETAMGVKLNTQKGENLDYVYAVKEMNRIIVDRMFSVLKILNMTFFLTRDFYIQRKMLNVIHSFTGRVIKEKRKQLTKGMSPKKNTFLDLLLTYQNEHGEGLSETQICNEVNTFMFEGHDTVSACVVFTLFSLANNPDIQAKVLHEQQQLFGDDKNPLIKYQHLQQMKYLENVIKESLRLYPPVPIIARKASKHQRFDGKEIDDDTSLFLFIYGIHRNAQLYPDPDKFDPDRFDLIDGTCPYAYLPFSAGERNCIGQKFAMLEVKSLISKVVRHFELKPAHPEHVCQLVAEVILNSSNGVRIGLNKRL